jgi:exodeoxyribonuclease VII large subunit
MSQTDTPAATNLPELTVSELSASLKRTVEDNYAYVRVRGELGNVKYHASGHVYLDLKDEGACLAGVVWRQTAQRLKVKLTPGLEVVATGRLTTYPGQSKYQLVVDSVQPAGLGALMALLDERRKALTAEGLFDPARKRPLPFLPRTIGVVTSPTGAVIRDILHRLADRFPRDVLVWPVRVQGEACAAEVAAAIRGFNALGPGDSLPRPDVLIVARGGGSLEDLWGFNEEVVVRAAAESAIPLISAVGHETDTTLIDFAADRRAPTPTAAAEIAVPVRADLLATLATLNGRLVGALGQHVGRRRTELRATARALPAPDALLAVPRQWLDTAAARLRPALAAAAQAKHLQFSRSAGRLRIEALQAAIDRAQERLASLGLRAGRAETANRATLAQRFTAGSARLAPAIGRELRGLRQRQETIAARFTPALAARTIEAARRRTDSLGQLLDALSYRGVLQRGFALVWDAAGAPVRSAAGIAPGTPLSIQFADGHVETTTDGAPVPGHARPRPRQAARKPPGGMGDLFE